MPSKRFQRPQRRLETRKLYVVATEGEKTEEIYFTIFNGEDFRKNVRVQVLPTRKGDSSPEAVVNRLREYIRKYGVKADDELWVVVDVDSWGNQKLDQLCRGCTRISANVAVSNPCFELWLVLHQDNPRTPPVKADCERELERFLGSYSHAKYNPDKLVPHIRSAIKHAKRLDRNPQEEWPRETGTRVYKLVENLLD